MVDVETKIIGVCGLGCIGKTYYCKNLLQTYEDDGKPRPVMLSLGAFFRETLGPAFFVHLDNPAAPAMTEHWVRNMVYFSIEMACHHKCDVIFDGFPRTDLQLEWLLLSSPASKRDLPVSLRLLYLKGQCAYDRRVRLRLLESKSESETSLIKERLLKDAALLSGLITKAKEMAAENKYYLDVEEVEYSHETTVDQI